MENDISLADIRKESRLKENCASLGIEYIEQRQDETDEERSERHHKLNTAIKSKKKVNARANYSPQKRKHVQDANAASQRHHRANLSPEQREDVRRSNTALRQQQRANLSPEQQENERRSNTSSKRRQQEMQQSVCRDNDVLYDDGCCTLNQPDKNFKKLLIREAIKQATHTKRPDGMHQATVCVVCDRVIIGDEKVCIISTLTTNTSLLCRLIAICSHCMHRSTCTLVFRQT
jgi:hypothetical protein